MPGVDNGRARTTAHYGMPRHPCVLRRRTATLAGRCVECRCPACPQNQKRMKEEDEAKAALREERAMYFKQADDANKKDGDDDEGGEEPEEPPPPPDEKSALASALAVAEPDPRPLSCSPAHCPHTSAPRSHGLPAPKIEPFPARRERR